MFVQAQLAQQRRGHKHPFVGGRYREIRTDLKRFDYPCGSVEKLLFPPKEPAQRYVSCEFQGKPFSA